MKLAALAALTLVAAACGDDPPPDSDVDGCTHLEFGPYTAVTATVGKDIQTPTIRSDESAFTVTLPASGIGYVKFEATEAREFVAVLDRDVPFQVQTSASAPVTLTSSAKSSAACTTIKGRYSFTLPIGSNFIGIGPDANGPVNVAIE